MPEKDVPCSGETGRPGTPMTWRCTQCTYDNEDAAAACAMFAAAGLRGHAGRRAHCVGAAGSALQMRRALWRWPGRHGVPGLHAGQRPSLRDLCGLRTRAGRRIGAGAVRDRGRRRLAVLFPQRALRCDLHSARSAALPQARADFRGCGPVQRARSSPCALRSSPPPPASSARNRSARRSGKAYRTTKSRCSAGCCRWSTPASTKRSMHGLPATPAPTQRQSASSTRRLCDAMPQGREVRAR